MKKQCVLFLILITIVTTVVVTGCGGFSGTQVVIEFGLSLNHTEGGDIEISPDSGAHIVGTEVTLTATAHDGWEFYGWEGDLSGSQNPTLIIMNDDKSIGALFRELVSLDYSVTGEGSVTVEPEQEAYSVTDAITLTAVPSEEWAFDHWENGATGSDNPLEISLDESATIVAVFVYVDSVIPVINIIGNTTVYTAAGSVYTDMGATATDDIDGDITDNIVILSTVDNQVPGVYTVSYNVDDSTGNAATEVTREVIVDGEAPVISLIGEASYTISVDEDWTEPGTTAIDDVDGDISSNVWSNYGYFFTPRTADTFIFEYNVSDRAGNAAETVTREITAVDTTPPIITRIGSSPVLIELGDVYTDEGATAEDNVDGDVSGNIIVDNPVDTNTAGVYTVTYNVSDAAGNVAVEVSRQVEVIVFETMLDGVEENTDKGYGIAEDSSGGYVIAGTTYGGGVFPTNMWAVKIDGSGDAVWDATYGNYKTDVGNAVCSTSDGGAVFTGYVTDTTSLGDPRHAIVVKHASDGQVAWQQELAGLNAAAGNGIIENSSGELLITGETTGETGASDLWVVKLDATGTTVWEVNYGGENGETGYHIVEAADGSYVIAGTTMSYGAGSVDAWIVKVDATGALVWSYDFGGSGDDYAYSIAEAADGSFVVAGTTNSSGAGGTDAWIFNISDTGSLLSEATFGGTSNDSANDVIVHSSGEYIFIGTAPDSWGDHMWIVALDASLNQTWERTFFKWPDAQGSAIIETADGYLAAAGSVRYGGGGDYDIWCIKF